MDSFKKCLVQTAALALALLLLGAGTILAVDPFFHYHPPLEKLAYTIDSATRFYYTPGLVRHSDYDSIMIGSSVAAAFKPQAFADHMGLKTHLAAVDGAYPKNHALVAQLALDSHPQVETVFIALDLWYLGMPPEAYYDGEMPLYLYDENPFSDAEYLLNKRVLADYTAEVFFKTAQGGATPDPAQVFDRPWNNTFRESQTLHSLQEQMANPASMLAYDTENRPQNAQANLEENLLPLLRANPAVTFKLILPPVSYAFLYGLMEKGSFDVALEELAVTVKGLLSQPNAEVYCFLGMEEVAANLYCYSDVVHFPDPVGELLIARMAGGEHRLTAGNWEGALETFGRRARAFNYEIYFGGESVPTKRTDDLAGFVAAFERQPERYLLLAASGGEAEISFGPYLRAQLGRLGLMDDAPDRAGGYVAAVDAGETLLESYGYEAASVLAPDGLDCALAAGRTGQFHRLDIDGISYGMCGAGINLVLYDKAQGCVVDNITLENADMPELSRQLYAFN